MTDAPADNKGMHFHLKKSTLRLEGQPQVCSLFELVQLIIVEISFHFVTLLLQNKIIS